MLMEILLKKVHTASEFQKSLTLPPCCQSPHFVGSFSLFVISSPVLGSVSTNTKSTNRSRDPTSAYQSRKNHNTKFPLSVVNFLRKLISYHKKNISYQYPYTFIFVNHYYILGIGCNLSFSWNRFIRGDSSFSKDPFKIFVLRRKAPKYIAHLIFMSNGKMNEDYINRSTRTIIIYSQKCI